MTNLTDPQTTKRIPLNIASNPKSIKMKQKDIEHYVRAYHNSLRPDNRYASYDYCYNYFYSKPDLTTDLEKSCAMLGFFLASWGMFRGKSLLQKSIKHYQSTILYLASVREEVLQIDVDEYDSTDAILRSIYEDIKDLMLASGKRDLTVITKILLGVFGVVPAFDSLFCKTFKLMFPYCSFSKVNYDSLMCIREFYNNNKTEIDMLTEELCTIDFMTGKKTDIHYTKAKIIDMYGWQKAFVNEETQSIIVYPAPVLTPFDNTIKQTTPAILQASRSRQFGTKKSVVEKMLSTDQGATVEEMARTIAEVGIDDDIDVNKSTVTQWLYKIGFKVEKLPDGRYRETSSS